MEKPNGQKDFTPCTIDNPDDFYIVQRLKDDEELKNYLNNCLTRYDYWAVSRRFPESRAAKGLLWKCEVLKRILVERGLEVPSLYDVVFGYEPPVKKRALKNGLQEEIRAAEQALKEQRARATRTPTPVSSPSSQDAQPPEDDSQGTEPIEGV